MNCENCGAPMTPVAGRNYLSCNYCDTFHFPSELEDSADRITPLHQAAELECPVCCQQLAAGAVDELRIMYCGGCRGLLFTSDVFAQAVRDRRSGYSGPEQTPVPIEPRLYERQLKCPGCKGAMEVHPYCGPGNAVIDSCAECRFIWLDHGELAAIERAPGKRRSAVPSYAPTAPPVEPEDTEHARVNLFNLLFG